MKHLIKILFILAFAMPFSMASATTHDDATMEAIEHSSSDRFENDIDLPDADDVAHDNEHATEKEHAKDEADDDKDDSADDKDDSADDKDDSADDKDDSKDDKDDSADDKDDSRDNSMPGSNTNL